MEFVNGRNRGDVVLFALSTCGWCKKTRELLDAHGVAYRYLYVDLLPQDEIADVMKTVEKFNPKCSFPTLVINNSQCIVGFLESEIREVLS
jgi:glutaredoxin